MMMGVCWFKTAPARESSASSAANRLRYLDIDDTGRVLGAPVLPASSVEYPTLAAARS